MGIVAVGSIGFDTIKTPFGQVNDIVGGSLTYFSLSASHFTDVSMVAVVGEDFTDEHMKLFTSQSRIDTGGIARVPGKTFRWGGEYSYNLNSRETLFTELNVFESFQPVLPDAYRNTDIVFLGNMHPSLQLSVLDQVQSKRLVGMDSMNLWIDITPNELRDVLKRVDILKIDDAEARQLADEYNLRKAAAKILSMGPKLLIATQGSHGSMMFNENGIFRAPTYLVEDEQDPTGAGDSFAGGFFGYLAQNPTLDDATLRRAMNFGSAMGSFDVEDFGTNRIASVTNDEVVDRYRRIKLMTYFEDA
jgi:sugar/nucleoside kinase (ribokinase family)